MKRVMLLLAAALLLSVVFAAQPCQAGPVHRVNRAYRHAVAASYYAPRHAPVVVVPVRVRPVVVAPVVRPYLHHYYRPYHHYSHPYRHGYYPY